MSRTLFSALPSALAASALLLAQPVQAQEAMNVRTSEDYTVEILSDTTKSAPKGTLTIKDMDQTKTLATLANRGDQSPWLKSFGATPGGPTPGNKFLFSKGTSRSFDFWLKFTNRDGFAYTCHVYVPFTSKIGVEKGTWNNKLAHKVVINTDDPKALMLMIKF